MNENALNERERKAADALKPWLTPFGLLRAWLALALLIFVSSVVVSVFNGPQTDLARWLLWQTIGALVASAAGIIAGGIAAHIGGSLILWLRRPKSRDN